jgi:hypothetical protein
MSRRSVADRIATSLGLLDAAPIRHFAPEVGVRLSRRTTAQGRAHRNTAATCLRSRTFIDGHPGQAVVLPIPGMDVLSLLRDSRLQVEPASNPVLLSGGLAAHVFLGAGDSSVYRPDRLRVAFLKDSVAQCDISWRQLSGEPARSKCVEFRRGFIELSAADTHGIDAAGWDLLIANGYFPTRWLERVGTSREQDEQVAPRIDA